MTFGKWNYVVMIAGLCIVLVGFFLMAGDSTTEEAFNPDIFSTTRIGVAPMVCLAGFVTIIVGIVIPKKK